MIKSFLKYILLLLLVTVLAGSIMYANKRAATSVCDSVEIYIDNEDDANFLTKEKLLADLKRDKIDVKNKLVSDIDLEKIERILDKYDYLESAECAIINNHKLLIKVEQIVPVLRVFDNNKSYYLNRSGKRINANYSVHMDVPIVKGNFSKGFNPNEIIPLAEFLLDDDARLTYVTMIEVKDKNNVLLVPIAHGHVINIGTPTDLKRKFEKIKLFYDKIVPYQGWYTYDTISVKWDYQIVASRRVKKMNRYIAFEADDEPDADFDTMSLPDRD
ncbi:MAG: hypothetical protein R3Y22_02270 [Bacteroidales bacterium]